jgi:hypothetical protein
MNNHKTMLIVALGVLLGLVALETVDAATISFDKPGSE